MSPLISSPSRPEPSIKYRTKAIMAAGRAILRLYRNLSFILQPCVLVAMMVVSEIMLRLSPKYAPPTITAISKGRFCPVFSAMPQAIGVNAAMVPTLVPILRETKQEAINNPQSIIFMGIKLRVIVTVASMAPICLAVDANAPARIKINTMVMISSFAAPLAKTAKRDSMFFSLTMKMEYKHAIRNETIMEAA